MLEIHIKVTEIRPEVPQCTTRPRVSEMSTLKKNSMVMETGTVYYGLCEGNMELCSVISCPNWCPWGDPTYRGDCSS